MKYWKMLHAILQKQPVKERDRFFTCFPKKMGIEKVKAFEPIERQREIMADVVLVGEAMIKNMIFPERA